MPTDVFYNFPKLTVNIPTVSGTPYYQSNPINITYPVQSMPVPNVQLNAINYFATVLYFSENANKKYLIMHCVDDVTSPQNYCFFTIELIPGANKENERDFEGCFSAGGGNIHFTLNNNIAQNDKITIGAAQNNCITILTSTPIKIFKPDAIFSVNPPANWQIPSGNTNGSLSQQAMEWNMNCIITHEDASQNIVKQNGTDINNALTLFLTSLMIAGGAYTLGPAIYKKIYEPINAVATTESGTSYASIDGHWGLTLVSAALACIIVGARNQKPIFYFVAITLCITYLAASQAVKTKLKEQEKTNILSIDGSPINILSKFGSHPILSTLMIIFFILMNILGNLKKEIPANTNVFSAMLISFVLCATGLSLWNKDPKISFAFTGIAILLAILWPSIAAGVAAAKK